MRIQKEIIFFSQLVNLKQKVSMMEHIEDVQKLNIRVKDIVEEHRIDVFIGILKYNIQHEVHLWELDSLEKAFRLARKMERKIMSTSLPLAIISIEVLLPLGIHNLKC